MLGPGDMKPATFDKMIARSIDEHYEQKIESEDIAK